MKQQEINTVLNDLIKNEAPSQDKYLSYINHLDFEIDTDFLNFIKYFNGAEGIIGANNYILIWNIEDQLSLNPYYEDNEDCQMDQMVQV